MYGVGSEVFYKKTGQKGFVEKVNVENRTHEIVLEDNSKVSASIEDIELARQVHEDNKFTDIALNIGKFTDKKNKQYGSSVDATYGMIKVLMERYRNDENTYLIPDSLLKHILLQVRMMDKINRLFNNPSGKGDSESPYKDLVGYGLIGIDMVERNEHSTNN